MNIGRLNRARRQGGGTAFVIHGSARLMDCRSIPCDQVRSALRCRMVQSSSQPAERLGSHHGAPALEPRKELGQRWPRVRRVARKQPRRAVVGRAADPNVKTVFCESAGRVAGHQHAIHIKQTIVGSVEDARTSMVGGYRRPSPRSGHLNPSTKGQFQQPHHLSPFELAAVSFCSRPDRIFNKTYDGRSHAASSSPSFSTGRPTTLL